MVPHTNWEYQVTTVSENFDYENLKLSSEEKFHVRDNKDVPVVIIFGWAGALDKYLRSYAKIYEERGLYTIRYITPVKYMFYQSNKMLNIGEEMAEAFRKQKLDGNPIIIHALSNGGCYQYEVFMRALQKTTQHNEVKGMIFDSCPVRRSYFRFYQAIKANVDSKYLKVPISFYLTSYSMSKRTIEMCLASIFNKESIQMNPYTNLIDEKYRWPQHFIYSTKDIVVDPKSVESFANHRKTLGVDVTMKRYENSQHVQHYLKNRSSYVRSVVKFVNKCLRK